MPPHEPHLSRRAMVAGSLAAGLAAAARAAFPVRLAPRHAGVVPIRGVDLSFLDQLTDLGTIFQDETGPRDPLLILADRGINTVRLRIWNDPADGFCSPARTLAMAQRIRDAGLRLFIDFHYSDSWADPGQQTPPAAWNGLALPQLRNAVHDFTADVITQLVAQDTPPDLVQVGNEITDGMLWPHGRISASGWGPFADLYNAGAQAVRLHCPGAQLLLHTDRGGDNGACRWFYDNALARTMPFDAIALSYYCWWHGSLAALTANCTDLASRYHLPIHIAETAYPFTLGWNDNQHNIVGLASQCLPGFPPTPSGQARYTVRLLQTLAALPDNLGHGVCWWAPDWIATPALPSPWENLALFDFNSRVLPAAAALGRAVIPRVSPIPD